MSKSWTTFLNKDTVSIDVAPYISSISGTALIGQLSKIEVSGINFSSDSQLISPAGEISNIQKSPELITFDVLASTPGSYPIEIKNGTKSSNDWGISTPLVIARNALNLTNGWFDFRVNSAVGSVTSHINQGLSTKTFANSGYSLDSTRGLIFNNATFTANSVNNYIQFNDYLFPLKASKFEVFVNFDRNVTSNISINRLRVGVGTAISPLNIPVSVFDYTNGNLTISQRYLSPVFSPTFLFSNLNNNFLNNNFYYLKIIWDFVSNKIEIHKLNDNSNLDAINKIDEFSTNILNRTMNSEGIPLFQFYNSGSLSSVIAMKID